MKRSLRFKITFFLTVLLILIVFLCWLMNSTLLDNYYQYRKVVSLSEAYNEAAETLANGNLDINDNSVKKLELIEASYNVNLYIISERISILGFTGLYFEYPYSLDMSDRENSIIRSEKARRVQYALQQYIFDTPGLDDNKPELLKTVDNKYDIYKIKDFELYSEYIDLVGILDNGYLVFIRSNYENIAESSMISSTFLAITGFIVTVIGTVLMFIFSKRFTQPINELADISQRMAALDFSVGYCGDRTDEIGNLGKSINTMSNELERTISELKTANTELTNEIARKIEIDELRKDFLSNVSHELKTPIALIQGYAEGLQDNISDDTESREFYCSVIIDEAQKMNNMVKKLMSLNEIEFGNSSAEMTRLNIVELVRSVAYSFEILAQSKGIRIICEDREPIHVCADDSLIEEVVTNYLSNALNHADGQKIVDISFRVIDDKVRVSVFNTGSVIPEEELENIWVKFYKVDKARTREYGGSGIGLSIVKAIMDRHGQNFGVKNHTAGVEFWFELEIVEK